MGTPIFFHVYRMADRLFQGSSLRMAVPKAIFTGVVGGMPSNALFLALGTLLEAKVFSTQQSKDAALEEVVSARLQNDLPRLIQASIVFWLPMDSFNFALASPRHRVLMT